MNVWSGSLACDDGNVVNTDGCSNTGTINAGYYCPRGTLGSADVCVDVCGDGIDKYGLLTTRCDDGNNVPFDGCDALCFLEKGFANNGVKIFEVCGDGYKKTD